MFKEQVAAGIDLLDKEYPGWRDKINRETLNLRRPSLCVLGCLFPGLCFDDALEILGLNEGNSGEYGFDIPLDYRPIGGFNTSECYKELTDCWLQAL